MNDTATIAAMAKHLVDQKVDLGDERAVLRALTPRLGEASRFATTSADVIALMDRAVDAARVIADRPSHPAVIMEASMNATAQFEPDNALQQWRDQIEENKRLEQMVADLQEQLAGERQTNLQLVFEVRHYRSEYAIAKAEEQHQRRWRAMAEGHIQAIIKLADHAASTMTALANDAIEMLEAEPTVELAPKPSDPPPPLLPAEPAPAAPPADLPAFPIAADDDGDDPLPMFLRRPAGAEARA